jgi:hypothetical protein
LLRFALALLLGGTATNTVCDGSTGDPGLLSSNELGKKIYFIPLVSLRVTLSLKDIFIFMEFPLTDIMLDFTWPIDFTGIKKKRIKEIKQNEII